MKFVLLIAAFLLSFKEYNVKNLRNITREKVSLCSYLQYDTSAEKLKSFKSFSRSFFKATRLSDTNYIREHVIFPIVNSSFYNMDTTIPENKKIGYEYFLAKLHSIFPKDIINRIQKEGEFMVSKNQKKYVIVLYNSGDNSGEIESNYSWFFVRKQDKFYFTQFRVEGY
jgi:hypothetical protein